MDRKLTTQDLHLITQNLLDMKSQQSDLKILDVYSMLFPGKEIKNQNKAFIYLIKLLHPDRINFHNKELGKKGNKDVRFYKTLFKIIDSSETKTNYITKIETHECYDYSEDDFDDVVDYSSPYDDFEDEYIYEEKMNFDLIDAFKISFIGNDTSTIITPSMISMTSGYVDFSNLGINNINGIEYYLHIERLNLNSNKIDNLSGIGHLHQLKELHLCGNFLDDIEELANLSNLEILDVSNNEIDDFSVLLKLKSLKYVNMMNNCNLDRNIRSKLDKLGTVVFE